MKKALATLSMALVTAVAANAQAVLGYTVAESQGTYTPLDNPTVVFDGSKDAVSGMFYRAVITPDGVQESMGTAQGFSLGFEADIAGETYTDFLVSTSGNIYLGNGEISYNPMMSSNFLTYGTTFVNAGFAVPQGSGFDENTKISYQTLGTGDDARLVVQYENYIVQDNNRNNVAIDAQTILDKSGRVQVVLSDMGDIPEDASVGFYIGVRQYGNYVSANGDSGSLATVRNDRDLASFTSATPDGTTVTFNVPQACVKPAAQPTDLVLTGTSDEIKGSFTACDGADNYLVVYTEGDATGEAPADGTTYKAGDKLGDATVAYYGEKTTFAQQNLDGGKEYTFTVYALNAYGTDGPVYNTAEPLTASLATLPAPAEGLEFTAMSANSLSFKAVSNAAGDRVVVLYNTYCQRVNTGDHGYFAPLSGELKAGDVLPVAEDFTPYWTFEGAPMPENGGTVAYAGDASETVTVDGLESGTQYYFAVYTVNEAGEYTSLPLYGGAGTYIEEPYEGNTYNFPRYELPYGWSSSEAGATTYSFRTQDFMNPSTGELRQGPQPIQQTCQIQRGDAVNGKEAWLTPAPVAVNERHAMAKFEYCITASLSRFQTDAYNDWAEGDQLQIRLSEDNGETWEVVASYTPDEHPRQEETLSYVSIAADLNAYRGKTVLVQLYWKTFTAPAFGANIYVGCFSVLQGEFPAVPEVTVGKVTHDTAVVSWVSQQTDYELSYKAKDAAEATTVTVEGAKTYTLTGLEANTEYEVMVRGIIEGAEDAYSEWSDPVDFTTADYPAVDAPENLTVNTDSYLEDNKVVLTWDAPEEALSYEVACRLASSTEWIYTNCEENTLAIEGLEAGETYICKVRAFCTHDRETPYSAQVRFTVPLKAGVDSAVNAAAAVIAGQGCIAVTGAEGAAVAVYSVAGVKVAGNACASAEEHYSLSGGLYMVTVDGVCHKVTVK